MKAPITDLKKRIQSLKKLPAMPQMAARVIQLKQKPHADIHELAEIIEMDPSLSAQVIRYAQSPYFGYRGNVDSVHTAISRVLGYEVVLNLAFGIATAKSYRIPTEGPLGLRAFWQHAIYAGALVQALSNIQGVDTRLPSGLVYLAGLLHNFGLLVLGQLFPKEFVMLNRLAAQYPMAEITRIEQKMFGVHHGQVGAWVMKAWNLPEEVVVAALHHHNDAYIGPHEDYARLVNLANRVLKREGIGDSVHTNMPEELLSSLELGEYMVLLELKRILEGNAGLNAMVSNML